MRFHSVLSVLAIAAGLGTTGWGRELPMLIERTADSTYRVRGNGYAIAIDGAGMALSTGGGAARLQWLGANGGTLQAAEPLATRINYMTGQDRSQWRLGVPTFGRLRQAGLYRGIDLVYYGTDRQLEYDFLVHPGGDPGAIRFSAPATLEANGDLRLANGLLWHKPVAKQGGKEIAAHFVRRGKGEFGVAVAAYDRTQDLVIDPLLTYGTYLGGTLADEAKGIAADAAGAAFVTGTTASGDFPGTTRGITFGGQDVFVAKLSPSGKTLEWATYVGGTGADQGMAIALDASGDLYVTGSTASTNFPVTAGAPQSGLSGGSGVTDAFVFKLSGNGQNLIYSTYLGGSRSDAGLAIAVDAAGAAYAGGRSESTDFPSTTRDTLPARGAGDGFVTKVAADGKALVYSSMLGGFALDQVNGLVVNAAGEAIVTGETRSDNFPVTDGAYQRERRGNSDAFITRLSANGASLQFSSYYGGDGPDEGRAVAVDNFGNIHIAGSTGSVNLPVSYNAAQRSPSLLPDAFAAKVDSVGRSLLYGTYLGGDAEDQATGIVLEPTGSAYVTGFTLSANYPLLNDGPLGAEGPKGGYDGFLSRLSSGGNFIQYSTYYGGSGSDRIQGIATDGRGRLWVAGVTDSPNLPTSTGALATRAVGATDGFVALLSEISVAITPDKVTLGPRESQQFTATVSNTANTSVRWSVFPEVGTITQTGLYTAPATIAASPVVTVSAISLADGSKVGEALVTLVNRVSVTVSPTEVALRPGGTQQFTPTVSGTDNTAVTWTLSPPIGTISASGLYSAPATFLAESTVTVRATSVAETSRFATAVVRLQLAPPPPLPAITAEGITNAASFRGSLAERGIAPGELITLFGTNMGPASPVTLQLDGRGFVSNRLGGTRVLFDGTPGAMIMASSGQVSVVVPYGLEGLTATSVQVEYEGRVSPAVTVPVTGSAPGIFTQNSSGSGAGSIIRQTGELITGARPAAAGEVLTLFGTGEGATNPVGVDGKPTGTPLPLPKLPVKVVIDGIDYDPSYAGGAPGLVAGVLQVNFTMPAGSPGARKIRLRIGDQLSPDVVTVDRQ
ncbi:MAG TPA: SBBP repeat-containing protein [Bryobacteraceae bacterium]|nr:SBBP repeat-containing protein [Bryobacteraceae bacterium]